jgi:4-hydroxy-tetrahydrodipicolinate reductase
MGQRVIAMMQADAQLTLAGAVTHSRHPTVGRDAGEVAGGGTAGVRISDDASLAMAQADVVIDFSVQDAAVTYLNTAAELGKSMVIGTTGFTAAQRDEMERQSGKVACFFAPNMSVGVHVMYQALRQLVTLLGSDYDVEILEAHHRTKIDAPSGTALRMASIVSEARGSNLDDVAVYGRQGKVGRRPDSAIGIQAVRAGDIVGEHTVLFGGIGERIELTHRSQSRDTFARGALRAAGWIVGQNPGLYGMDDLLRPS